MANGFLGGCCMLQLSLPDACRKSLVPLGVILSKGENEGGKKKFRESN